MIKVLIVEDSTVIQQLLRMILDSDPDIEVVGVAKNGEMAIRYINDAHTNSLPDVISMDIVMPGMDGLEATRRILERFPIPIIMVSAQVNSADIDRTFDCLNAGAVSVINTPPGPGHPNHKKKAWELIQKVKLISEIKVVTRKASLTNHYSHGGPVDNIQKEIKLIAIGASTGGPVAIQEILSHLPKDFPVPLLITQHISEGFIQGFVRWLGYHTELRVQLAEHQGVAIPGNVYLAPDDFHMGIQGGNRIVLSEAEPINGLRPSVSYLFRSIAEDCAENAIGIILSGMGKDGAEELKLLNDRGAITIAQDEQSSILYGMPREAIAINGAQLILPPIKIAQKLITLIKGEKSHEG